VDLARNKASGGDARGDKISGFENAIGSAFDDVLTGTRGGNVLEGGSGNDKLYGDAGNDTLKGEDGSDWLFGGSGNDTLDGGDGNDAFEGGDGDDKVHGGSGDDDLAGDNGADTLDGQVGNDTIWAGQGDDFLFGGEGADVFTFSLSAGNDRVEDFEDGVDQLHILSNFGLTADDIVNATIQVGLDAVIDLGQSTTITLVNYFANAGVTREDIAKNIVIFDSQHIYA
jgi:Ca2+-binding RTX toxin-like protein